MKKITSFLMMFMLFVGMGWAQKTLPVKLSTDTEEYPYYINADAIRTFYVTKRNSYDKDGTLTANSTGEKLQFLFKAASVEGQYFIYIKDGNEQIPLIYDGAIKAKKNGNPASWILTPIGRVAESDIASGGTAFFNIQLPTEMGKSWNPEGGMGDKKTNNPMKLWGKNDPNSKWHINYAGKIKSSELTIVDGQPTFGDNMHWYNIVINGNTGENRGVKYIPSTERSDVNVDFALEAAKEKLYAFVGDDSNGYEIYNYVAGPTKILWSETVTDDGTPIKMVEKSTATKNSKWKIGGNKEGWHLLKSSSEADDNNQKNGYINARYNDNRPCLSYWKSTNAAEDNGSRLEFIPVSKSEFVRLTTKNQSVELNAGYKMIFSKVGGKTVYLQIEEDGSFKISEQPVYSFNITKAGLLEGQTGYMDAAAYYLTMNGYRLSHWNGTAFNTNKIADNKQGAQGIWHSQVITEFNGKYAIRCTNNPGEGTNSDHYIVSNGNGIQAVKSTTASEESLYQWEIRDGYPFDLTTDLQQPVCYQIRTNRDLVSNQWLKQYYHYDATDSKVSLVSASLIDRNVWCFTENFNDSKKAYRLQIRPAMATNMALTYTDTGDGAAKVVVKNMSNLGGSQSDWMMDLNNSTAPYGFRTVGGENYLSNNGGVSNKMGFYHDGPSKDKGTAVNFEAVDFAKVIKTDAFYRLQGKASGKYMDALNLSDTNIGMSAYDDKNLGLVFYLDEYGKLLSYYKGTYLKETCLVSAQGAGAASVLSIVTVPENKAEGYYNLKAMNSGSQFVYDNNSKVDRNSGYKADNCDWKFIPVEALPVNFGSDGKRAGAFATMYAPVALQLPAEVHAFKGVNENQKVMLTEVSGVIPAKQGVVLKTDAAGTVLLPIVNGNSDADMSGNQFEGGIETRAIENGKAYYAMGNKSSLGIAFYTLGGNTIKGFRAVLPKAVAGQANELRMVFDGDLTGVENVEVENIENTEIYDLSGRRVVTPTKGLYIVNGKKVYVK